MTANTETQAGEESEMNFGEEMKLATMLTDAMNAEQLRRFAHHHDVARNRGDNKMQTALKVVRENPDAAQRVNLHGDFVLYCGHCGTRGGQRFETSSAEVVVEEAKQHKSENPTHFPLALDIRGEDVERLYG